jgi:hypothetical protein
MSALAFPQTPSVNDTFTSAGRSWRWTGTRWSVVAQPISPSRLSGEGAQVGDALVFDGENYSPFPIEVAQADWNATSGAAQILNKPTLGTAAATAATDYATAAQGVKADASVQKNTADSTPVNSIRAITQSEYDALTPKEPNTIYFIKQ